MLVSWNWLKEYVTLDMSVEELEMRLMMAGLNHEGTECLGGESNPRDWVIDLEVTSNRPDCLGHLGVAREIAVLWDRDLKIPSVDLAEGKTAVTELTSVTNEAPELCRRYTARVIRGVKVGPSPAWLVARLEALGIGVVNNVVDISNYVLFESGQPLHTFDFAKLQGQKIVVREAQQGEEFVAIDHKTYKLNRGTCVIADAGQAVALGGVMGGADTEVSAATTDLLIEAAEFDQLSVRTTARALNLHSPSSYRFERGVDRENIDWASRRCCQLILDLAGGELAAGVISVGLEKEDRKPVTLRFEQLKRILGIEVPTDTVKKILTELGMEDLSRNGKQNGQAIEVLPPTWRRDLTREIDLIEEVARIHGYDKIPEDAGVPMVPSSRSKEDRVFEKARHLVLAAGFDEAMTISATNEQVAESFSPWTDTAPLNCGTPVLRGANLLRRSLVPSLLGARRTNEALSNPRIELFEIANVYLAVKDSLPKEMRMLTLASGHDFLTVKGVIESLLSSIAPAAVLEVIGTEQPLLAADQSCELRIGGETFGFLGVVSEAGLERFDLQRPATVAEIRLQPLVDLAELVPQTSALSPYPAVSNDLNMVFDEAVRWADVESIVRSGGGNLLEQVEYLDTYRHAKQIGSGKKSLLLSFRLRAADETLTREKADAVRERIVSELGQKLGGQQR